ncbi:phage infection protein [Burkholderia multivorans]|uniref:Phage infection protein n=1 Tax=Burkholderia multivorans TaxID=87883 RepID=A0AB37AQY2_9BURK|nr:phage infection protein [Burkholderia multivorans]PRE43870.1 phage infection protein [Burkholderia multivorans]PRE54672.1 phage infection protein [Burkholderia multivorans]
MKAVSIDLENCYGIKRLQAKFDFSKAKACAIYAPNGSMKSSLAQTFQDVADGTASRDRIFTARACRREIKDEAGTDLSKGSVLVVRPYDEVLGHSAKTSTLLVNPALRKEYEALYSDIDAAKEALLKALKEQSGSKKDIEKELSATFTARDDQFYVALNRIKDEVTAMQDSSLATVSYDVIFDDKVLALLTTEEAKSAIQDYIKKYNELLAASTYFKKGTFNYYNASTVAKQLADNGFFDAKHTVTLNADTKLEINSQKDLEELIAKEKDAITNDQDLKRKFAKLDKLMQKNVTVRDFEAYLLNHEELLVRLGNIPAFKEDIWKSYLKARFEQFQDLLNKYQAAETRRKEIEGQAAKERTQWEEVIEIFNDRFFVPFKLEATNRLAVILGQEPMLSLGFTFEDAGDKAAVDRGALMQALSTGEKKAFYVLNILFEIEVRKKAEQETLVIVDDIADSFDYKNKYAIIQYLMDIAEDPHFKQIILTHNFDFYRTIQSRFVRYSDCFMATKTATGLVLEQAAGIQNVFVKDWKPNFAHEPKKKVACIPFMRNLIEYTKDAADPDFVKLTSLLHWKADSDQIKVSDLDVIFNRLFDQNVASADGARSVMDLIAYEAGECLGAAEGINFENKIVLAMSIRLTAERFMIKRINDPAFVATIDSNQTPKLLKKFRELFGTELKTISVLQRVVLMTPENIHLNSFMYEPILDMSDGHLRRLYGEVTALA